jgi:ornithine carbamoyltransferase
MPLRHYVADTDLLPREIEAVLGLAARMKCAPGKFRRALDGKTLGMIFQKSSTRTRVSFETGMLQLGGHALFLSSRDIQIGRGETIADTARVLSRYMDALMARVYGHGDVVELARHASVPVINGLSDLLHPCQALADYLTLKERFGKIKGLALCYLGDGNNVAHSLMLTGAALGVSVRVVTPRGYEPKADIVEKARALGRASGASVLVTRSLDEGLRGASAVYTDVWASMGQEEEAEARKKIFMPLQITPAVMKKAEKDAIFLHCLPAHRGEEVVDAVIDSSQSAVWDQAENRLHAQKALMVTLMKWAGTEPIRRKGH